MKHDEDAYPNAAEDVLFESPHKIVGIFWYACCKHVFVPTGPPRFNKTATCPSGASRK